MTGSAISLFAVPAKPTPIKFTQPDGSTVMLKLTGDEHNHMLLTTEGYPVARDEAGYYCFAKINDAGEIKPTEVRAELVSRLSAADRLTVDEIDTAMIRKTLSARKSPRAKVASRAGSHAGIGLMDDAFLGYKELKGLVILAQFADKKFDSKYGNAYFTEMLNKEGFKQYNATGSARDYFVDSSNGAFIPEFDVYGPVTLPQNMAYYGGNDLYGNDLRPAQMVRDACKGLDEEINFKEYDIDGDGYVDNVFVFYAGLGEASSGEEDTVWPHQWNLASARINLTLDGVIIDKYACSNELEGSMPCGIGTFVHEFSHVLGLPDLYATVNDGDWTPGDWSVMDMGSYSNNGRTPPSYSSYERNALGWVDLVEITGPANIRLESLTGSNKACIIPTPKQNEFFLLENRQKEGWDKYIPGHGMLIWHIDYNNSVWEDNEVNNKQSHNYVDIEEASGTYRGSAAAYAFPGTKNVTSFTDDTTPSMQTWAGVKLNLPITDIKEVNGIIKFKVAGGRGDADVPVVNAPQEIGDNWFVASWNAAEGASGYLLTVEKGIATGFTMTETADFGEDATAVLPDGWEFVNMDGNNVYQTAGNYGAAAPSLKLSASGYGFMTREFDGEIKSISFWLKGQSTDEKSCVKIEGHSAGQWLLIEEVYPLKNKVSEVELTEIPSGILQLKVTYVKSAGNVAIDDFTVTTDGGGTVALDGYNALNVGNVTSYKVIDIPADAGAISYKVCAVDENGIASDFSESQTVYLDNAGIDAVSVETDASFAVDGDRVVYRGTAGARLMLIDFAGRTVTTAVADNDGVGELKAPSTGIYILVAPSLTAKVAVK